MGMARLHRPGVEPGKNAMKALTDIAGRGCPARFLAGDRAYSNVKAEDFQLPALSLGYRVVFDYRIDQLGIMDGAEGFIQVEGAWYCPSMPEPLVNATSDHRNGVIDEDVCQARLEERKKYRARAKGRPDAEEHQRFQCPAAGGAPTARCPVKPESMRSRKSVSVRIMPKRQIAASPPKACSQQTVTIAPEQGAKLAQDLAHGTEEWQAHYSTLRNSIEGLNGYVKDGAHEALADPTRRRIRGVAAQSVFAAFLLFATNLRKIESFLLEEAVIEAGGMKRLRRRRKGRSLQDWHPAPGSVGEPTPPAPD